MNINQKLIAGFAVIALLIGVVGAYSLMIQRQVVKSFESKEVHFREIITAATKATSYAKRAEGHLMLFLFLNDKSDKEKFFERYNSLKVEIRILKEKIRNPEARKILESIILEADKLLPRSQELFKAYEQEVRRKGRFEPKKHEKLIRDINNVTSIIRGQGVELATFEAELESKTKVAALERAVVLQRNALVVIIGVTIIAFVIGYIFTKTITGPLIKLEKATVEIGKGNFATPIEVNSKDEIGILALSFKNMMAALENSRAEQQQLILQLQDSLAQIKTLSGLLPICAHCKKIRDDQGYWNQIEVYIRNHSEAEFTHGICPECMKRLYPEVKLQVRPAPELK